MKNIELFGSIQNGNWDMYPVLFLLLDNYGYAD